MLPDIKGQQRLQPLHHRIGRPLLLRDNQVAISISRQPYPARAKQTNTLSFKLSLESLETSPLLHNLCSECPLRFLRSLSDRFKLQEIHLVVQYLSSVVKDSPSRRLSHNFFQCHTLILTARKQFVKIIHVSSQVLPMMEIYSLFTNHWLQCIWSIWQCHQFIFHHINSLSLFSLLPSGICIR